MKIAAGIIFFSLILISCRNGERNEGILSPRQMDEVMWDMVRADQYVSDHFIRDSSLNKKDESEKLYEEIFYIHKISRDQFKKSLSYYSSRPDLFRPILDSLSKHKMDQFKTPSKPRPPVLDSARKPFLRKHIPKH